MPRTGDVYAPPAGTKGTPNTTIQSAPYNSFVDDLTADANAARPITAGGTGATNATAARTALGAQQQDAGLQSISDLVTVANQMLYLTGTDLYATTALTPFARTLLDDADAATMRATIGAQANLGFTPVQQGGGTGQGTNKVYIGWNASGPAKLRLQIDNTDFVNLWPIDISGVAADSAALGGTSLATLNASIAGKVSKSGDQMNGDMQFINGTGTAGSSPVLRFTAQTFRQWYWQAYGNGSANYFRLVDETGAAERFRVGVDGTLWCSQLGDISARIESRAAAFADDRKNACVTASRCAGLISVPVKTGSTGGGDINNSAYFLTRAVKTNVDEVTFESRQPQLYIANVGWFAAFPF